jgi:hypothetical protein
VIMISPITTRGAVAHNCRVVVSLDHVDDVIRAMLDLRAYVAPQVLRHSADLDEDIDTSDIPEAGEEFFKNAKFKPGPARFERFKRGFGRAMSELGYWIRSI